MNKILNDLVSESVSKSEKDNIISGASDFFEENAHVQIYKGSLATGHPEKFDFYLKRLKIYSNRITTVNFIETNSLRNEASKKYKLIAVQEIWE
jgi:hypothetical protein